MCVCVCVYQCMIMKERGTLPSSARSFSPCSRGFTSQFLPTRQCQEALTIREELDTHTQKWQTHILERPAAVPLYYLSISTPIRANLQVKGQPAAFSEANDKGL